MAKIICKKCGKIFSDVSAFCPKCGAPAEISSRPEFIGGRQMASAGRSARTNGTGSIDGKVFSSGDLLNEGSPRGSGKEMSHSHSSFDDICSDDDPSPLGSAVKKLAEKHSGGAKTHSASINFRRNTSGQSTAGRGTGSISGSPYSSDNAGARRGSGRYQVKTQPGKIIVAIIAVIIGLNILSVLVTSCASLVTGSGSGMPEFGFDDTAETYAVTADDDSFMQTVANQLEYRDTLDEEALKNMTDEEYVVLFDDMINSELGELTPYQTSDTSDIEYYRDNYIDGLYQQLHALDFYTTDRSEFNYYWNFGYNERVYSIVNLYDYYGMQLSDDLYNVYKADYDRIYSPDEDAEPEEEAIPAEDGDAATLPSYGGRPVYDDGTTI